jgi:hypothetical protein
MALLTHIVLCGAHRLMCKNELLLKIAAASLVTLDMSPADSAALMACYQSKPRSAGFATSSCQRLKLYAGAT